VVVTYFKVLFQHLTGGTEQNHDKPPSGIERIVLLDFIHRLVSQKKIEE